jgi:hypothetical protein
MRGRRWWSLAVLAVAATAGCFWVRKPYADDPLIRRRPAPKGEPIVTPLTRPTPPGSTDRPPVRGVDLP